MHHIVSDGWSMGVLVRELSALYAAFAQGQPDPLPPLAVQYADYAVWQRTWITGEVLRNASSTSGASTCQGRRPCWSCPPTGRVRRCRTSRRGPWTLRSTKTSRPASRRSRRRHGTTLFMTLLASWAALLARLSGQSDVVIGTPVANRHRAEIEPLIGFFVNTQALRVDLSGQPTVAELLAQVRTTRPGRTGPPGHPLRAGGRAISPAAEHGSPPRCSR
jgi:hypothetical protein